MKSLCLFLLLGVSAYAQTNPTHRAGISIGTPEKKVNPGDVIQLPNGVGDRDEMDNWFVPSTLASTFTITSHGNDEWCAPSAWYRLPNYRDFAQGILIALMFFVTAYRMTKVITEYKLEHKREEKAWSDFEELQHTERTKIRADRDVAIAAGAKTPAKK